MQTLGTANKTWRLRTVYISSHLSQGYVKALKRCGAFHLRVRHAVHSCTAEIQLFTSDTPQLRVGDITSLRPSRCCDCTLRA